MIRRAAAVVVACVVPAVMAHPSMASQGEVTVRRDLVYATHDGSTLRLDAYLPSGGERRPGLIVIYGGRWVEGDKSDHPEIPMYFAQQGLAAFAVNYRSAEQAPFPAALKDLQAAVRWVRAHASGLGVDPAQLGVAGWSAGGHLAAMLATFGEGPLDRGSRIAAAVSWSGPMDLEALLDAPDPSLPPTVRTFLGCAVGPECIDVARAASPLTHVDASDAPMYIANSNAEIIPFNQAEAMAEALDRRGVAHVLREFPGRHHALGIGGNDKGLAEALAFLGERLGGVAFPEVLPGAETDGGGKSAAPQGTSPDLPATKDGRPAARSGPSTEPFPSWMLVLLTLAALALVVSAIQLQVGLRALREARTARADEGDAARPADYVLRRTEDTRQAP